MFFGTKVNHFYKTNFWQTVLRPKTSHRSESKILIYNFKGYKSKFFAIIILVFDSGIDKELS